MKIKEEQIQNIFSLSLADELIVIKNTRDFANIRFANNSITSSGHTNTENYDIISITDGRVGIVSTDSIGDKAKLEKLIRESESIAKNSPKAQDISELVKGESETGKTHEMDIEKFIYKIDKIFDGLSEYINSGYGEMSNTLTEVYNSKGLDKSYSKSYVYLAITSKSPDLTKSFWVGQNGYSLDDIDEDEMISKIRNDFGYASNISSIKAGQYDVILTPYCVVDFLMYLMFMMSLEESEEGRGVFSKFENNELKGSQIGEKLFPDFINFYSDPFDKSCPSLPFFEVSSSNPNSSVFDNGVDLNRVEWISKGVLKNLISTRSYSLKKGYKDCALAPTNFLLEGHTGRTVNDLIKDTKHGLLVNSIWYIRLVDPVTGLLTGLTRDGVYIIENGKIVGISNNFRFNQSPVELLKNITDMSESVLALPREFEDETVYKAPFLKVKDFNMSSVSDAI